MKIDLNKMFVDDEVREAVMDVLESGWYVKGPKAKEMEKEFAKIVGANHAVSCSWIQRPSFPFTSTATLPTWALLSI